MAQPPCSPRRTTMELEAERLRAVERLREPPELKERDAAWARAYAVADAAAKDAARARGIAKRPRKAPEDQRPESWRAHARSFEIGDTEDREDQWERAFRCVEEEAAVWGGGGRPPAPPEDAARPDEWALFLDARVKRRRVRKKRPRDKDLAALAAEDAMRSAKREKYAPRHVLLCRTAAPPPPAPARTVHLFQPLFFVLSDPRYGGWPVVLNPSFQPPPLRVALAPGEHFNCTVCHFPMSSANLAPQGTKGAGDAVYCPSCLRNCLPPNPFTRHPAAAARVPRSAARGALLRHAPHLW